MKYGAWSMRHAGDPTELEKRSCGAEKQSREREGKD